MKNTVILLLFLKTLLSCTTQQTSAEQTASIPALVLSPETTLVDVRIPEQYETATAKSAVNIPLADIEKNLDFFRKQKQTVVFCNSGRQADQAIKILRKKGIKNVYDGTSLRNIKAIQATSK